MSESLLIIFCLETIDYMFRVNADTVNFIPKICAQPIGYGEALVFLQ